MSVFITEEGATGRLTLGKRARGRPPLKRFKRRVKGKTISGLETTITLKHDFAETPTCLAVLSRCDLATGRDAGHLRVEEEFGSPNQLTLRAILPGIGSVPGRDMTGVSFHYVAIGVEK